MEPFKNIFNSQYIDKLSEQLSQNYSSFKTEEFKRLVPSLKKLELKDRVRLISHHLQKNLPSDYKKAIAILIQSLHSPKNPNGIEGFTTWPLLQFIEDYGLDDFETSFKAMFLIPNLLKLKNRYLRPHTLPILKKARMRR